LGGAQKARRVMACFAALGFVATRAANFLFMNCTHKHHRRSPFSTRAPDTRAKSAADRRLSHAGALFCVRAKSGNAEYYLMYQASAFALRVYMQNNMGALRTGRRRILAQRERFTAGTDAESEKFRRPEVRKRDVCSPVGRRNSLVH
jgi:hypothetical protein